MHEEPYAQSILDMALEKAGSRPIKKVILGLGRFSAIEPESLELFFSHLSRGTPAQGAILVFETVPVTLTCKTCSAVLTLDIPLDQPVRPALGRYLSRGCSCGSTSLSFSGGLGLDLIRLELGD
ncbi:hydrogenase maturation nickel metallochaperone HypA [Desulfospira joergensenii]|uniref:hydrogenase maturation nickel metallochaperone HypA/HybF n=1 Tax=Desulfospira joergensenii TaxID=53329 RepID=UPI0003B674B4|nr:hydrogenase maturation nickel metallochaperone HypA [Desulfospira joergensenii]